MTHVEANVEGEPASTVFTQTMRHSTFPAQGLYTMTMTRLLQSLNKKSCSGDRRRLHSVVTTRREGEVPDKIKYYPSSQYSFDTFGTFADLNLLHFSSPDVSLSASDARVTCGQQSKLPCLVSPGCYSRAQRCDGITDCLEDGVDEAG